MVFSSENHLEKENLKHNTRPPIGENERQASLQNQCQS